MAAAKIEDPLGAYPLNRVTLYLSSLLNNEQKLEEASVARKQLCDSLGAHFQYYEQQGEIPQEWLEQRMPLRNQLQYLNKGFFGLVFTKRSGKDIFALKIIKIDRNNPESEDTFNREVRTQTCVATHEIAPKIFDAFVCSTKGYGIIVMEFLEGYIPFHELPKDKLTETDVTTLLGNLFRIVDVLVNTCKLYIDDFQLMVNPTNWDIQIIDFGCTEDISNNPNKKQIQDELFINQCSFFTEWCSQLLNDPEWEKSWQNISPHETYEDFRNRTLQFFED